MTFDCVGCIYLSDSYETGIVSHCTRVFTDDEKVLPPCPFFTKPE